MNKISPVLLFSLFLFSIKSFAYIGAVSTATAGSGRAAFDMTEAPVSNPAAVAFLKGYFFNTGYGILDKGNQFYVSLTDNLPDTVLPSTLQYYQQNQKTQSQLDWTTQLIKYGIANYAGDSFSLGFGINHQIDSIWNSKYTQTNFSVGSLLSVSPNLTLAAVFDNIADPNTEIPTSYRFTPATSLGMAYNYKQFVRIRLDLETPASSNSFNQPNIATALESYWNRWVIIRFSARKESETKIDQYGAGLGFVGPKFAVHYGYIQSPQDEKLTRHAVDLAVPIW